MTQEENRTEDLALKVRPQTSSFNVTQELITKANSQAPPTPAELEPASHQDPGEWCVHSSPEPCSKALSKCSLL